MPRLGQDDMQQFNLAVSHFGFSAQKIDDLQATEYTLVTLAFDMSGSTEPFRDEMRKAAESVVEACRKSPRADNLLFRATTFSDNLSELHGFRQLTTIGPDEYKSLGNRGGGQTALYDACINGIEAMTIYGKSLTANDFSVNAICFIITDGMDNKSTQTTLGVKDTIEKAVRSEALESMVTVLIGVNLDNYAKQQLEEFMKQAGLNQFVNIGDASASKLAKLAEFVSKSISQQSQSLGSGTGASQQIQQQASLTF